MSSAESRRFSLFQNASATSFILLPPDRKSGDSPHDTMTIVAITRNGVGEAKSRRLNVYSIPPITRNGVGEAKSRRSDVHSLIITFHSSHFDKSISLNMETASKILKSAIH